ncbi:MAG: lipopolysaccharide biosynthesis protein RfbH [Planctomycetota bacterium]|nr:lipopolysaccharide biosynthesis protein RfbH [Planctomycetota bacterium]
MFDEASRRAILELVRGNREPPSRFVPGVTMIPASGKMVGNRERELMVEAALDGWLTVGRFNARFEEELSNFLGAAHVLTVNSGSSANLIALSALTSPELGKRAIRPGDEVVTAAAGFPTTIAPILQIGAVPVFVDVDPDSWNVDPARLPDALSAKTRAVFLAHTLGIPFDAEAAARFCRAHGLWLVEDCCDALGSEWNGAGAGSFGDIATLSFYPAHHITTGEGGAVFTNNAGLARLAESFRDWGRHCRCRPGQDNACGRRFAGRHGDLPEGYDHKYVFSHAGYNLKMTDMAAACGVAQMGRLPDFIRRRRENYARLRDRVRDCRFLRLPEIDGRANPSWFGFPVLLDENAPLGRTDLLERLDGRKIGSRLPFAGNALRQPFMRDRPYRAAGELVYSDLATRQGFWLGVWPGLAGEALEYMASNLLDLLAA